MRVHTNCAIIVAIVCMKGVHVREGYILNTVILFIKFIYNKNNLLPSGIPLSLHTTIAQLTPAHTT